MPEALSSILSDEAPAKEPVEVETPEREPSVAPPEKAERVESRRSAHRRREMEAQGRDPDTGKFVPKEKPEEAKAEAKEPKAEAAKEPVKAEAKPEPEAKQKEELTPKERAAFAAAADERRKRQMLEQELAKLRQPQAQQPPAAQGTPEKPKTFWDDPEAAFKAQQEAQRQEQMTTRLQVSEMISRNRHPSDFDANIEVFKEIANSVPGVAQQMLAAPDPAEFAYRVGKVHKELREAGGVEQMRQKIQKETREQVEKELREKAEKERAERQAIPQSLSQVKGATSTQNKVEWQGPTPMADILGRG